MTDFVGESGVREAIGVNLSTSVVKPSCMMSTIGIVA